MPSLLLIVTGALCAAVLALLGLRAADRVAGERRRRAVREAALDADCEVPVEEAPRLKNAWRVEGVLSSRAHGARIAHVPEPTVLRYRITAQGRPADPTVIRSSGSEAFDAAVMRAIAHARFAPARVNGWPVAVWVEQPFTWNPPAGGA
jgi:TonB family protein